MAAAPKKKGKKGLMIGLILLVVFGGVGAVLGLAMSGKINIPGVTPKKKPIPAAAATVKPKPPVVQPKKEDKPIETTKAPTAAENKLGYTKVAEVWNEMPIEKLSKIVDKWKPTELARILNEMDPTKVAEILGGMTPDKASNVSLELKAIAAQSPTE